MYGQGASRAESNLAGKTGMNMLAHLSGNNKLAKALLARCSIAVCEDRKMILDSDKANSSNDTIFGIVRHLKSAYKSVFRDSGNSFAASFLAKRRSSRTAISTWVLEDIGLNASVQRFTTYLSSGCHRPTLGELGGTRITPPSVMGTTTALNHSFQNPVMLASRPRIP